jgi:transcriptional regulatory protein RtcR
VEEEVDRLSALWANPLSTSREEPVLKLLNEEQISALDLFDRAQLNHVLEVCQRSRSLSEAGRTLFSASRGRKASTNDADRLRKYLYRFGIEWARIARPQES